MSDPVEPAQAVVGVVGEMMKIAGENPEVKEAGKNLSRAALTITKTINVCLLPLAAVNFAFDKARAYFAEKFQDDLAAKAAAIPPENIVEPKASIAGPALQGLAFTHEEPNLKEMYLKLLATAMDGRVSNDAHPAFVEIIKQLSAEDAGMLQLVIKKDDFTPMAEIRQSDANGAGHILLKHVMPLFNPKTKQLQENVRLPVIVDNWIRLGLVEVEYLRELMGENAYSWVKTRPEFLRLKQVHEKPGLSVTYKGGFLTRTSLGFQFAKTVGLLD